MATRMANDDSWLGIYWKSAAAIVYLLICLFDFIAVPTYLGVFAESLGQIIMSIKDLPPEIQSIILQHKLSAWEPLTLKGGGLFHVAFGAILGATAWGRSQERISEIRQGWTPGEINSPQHHPGARFDNPDQPYG